MKLQLTNGQLGTTFADMKDGDIAIITDKMYEGRLVQRNNYNNGVSSWFTLGGVSGESWLDRTNEPTIACRILESGECIEIL